jgi:hypothetical protein
MKKQKCIYCGFTQEHVKKENWVARNICSNCEELFLNETYSIVEEDKNSFTKEQHKQAIEHRHFGGELVCNQ